MDIRQKISVTPDNILSLIGNNKLKSYHLLEVISAGTKYYVSTVTMNAYGFYNKTWYLHCIDIPNLSSLFTHNKEVYTFYYPKQT